MAQHGDLEVAVHVGTLDHASGYAETHRSEDLSAGVYRLPAGRPDRQDQPHGEDEVYVVLRGEGSIEVAGRSHPVRPGSVVFVPAGVEHRFAGLASDLEAVVVFGPAEGARG